MKRRDFIRELTKAGCFLYRHGSKHDLYMNPATGKKAPIPRHQELKNTLCTLIRNQLGLLKK
ncbi:MAG: type II toxin-antitoxin system HicA family toxin [Deltaproteobacteria bacterium]|nr:type II toxin-antitoxin system HicA family toxin [Deltaproteobacteria bacterium]